MSSLRILMYCNDSRGLGQTTRTLNIATTLSKAFAGCSILVLTDLSTIGRFRLAERVDYVHLPLLETKKHSVHLAGGLNIEYENKLRIRRKIAQSTIKTFHPDVVILDESLLAHTEEMERLVDCVREELPAAKIIWGLSDTLGEAEVTQRHWRHNGVVEVFERAADEIWVYGAAHVCDVAATYELPTGIAQKIFYTGYLARLQMPARRVGESVAKWNRNLPMVMVSPGGGTGDLAMLEAYLRFLEKYDGPIPFQSFIVAGSAIGSYEKRSLAQRAQKLPNIMFHRFGKHTLQYARFAGFVIYTGDYNLTCEILAHRKPALAVFDAPEHPANASRARLLQERGLLKSVPPENYRPEILQEVIARAFLNGPRLSPKSAYENIPLDGFTKIAERIRRLCGLATPVELKIAS